MSVLPQILPGESRDCLPLLFIDRRLGRHEVAPAARLDLDETKRFLFPGDQVDVSMTARRAKVSGNDNEAEFAEIEVSFIFTVGTGHKMRSPRWTAAKRRIQTIQSANGESQHSIVRY